MLYKIKVIINYVLLGIAVERAFASMHKPRRRPPTSAKLGV